MINKWIWQHVIMTIEALEFVTASPVMIHIV